MRSSIKIPVKFATFDKQNETQHVQLLWLIGPLILFIWVSPFSGRQPNAAWRWRARMPHTHSTLMDMVKIQQFSSLFGRRNSLRRVFMFFIKLVLMLLSPSLRAPASLVEEFPIYHDVVPEHALGHPHPVESDVCCKILPKFNTVLVDRPIVGDDEGHHHSLHDFLFPCFLRRPFIVLLIIFFEGFIHLVSRCNLHVNHHLPPVASRISPEPRQVRLSFAPGTLP